MDELSECEKAALIAKLSGPDAESECAICRDMPQTPVLTLCGHGPMCLACITQHLDNQVPPTAKNFTKVGMGLCCLCKSNGAPAREFCWLPSTLLDYSVEKTVLTLLLAFSSSGQASLKWDAFVFRRLSGSCHFARSG